MTNATLDYEKHKADAFRLTSSGNEAEYWHAYRMALAARSEYHDALLAMIGDTDLGRDARGRGYRDGSAVRERA